MIPPTDNARNASFVTTSWSLLYAMREGCEPSESDKRFAQFISIYWRTICSFIRAHGYGASEAYEMTRRFIVSLVDRNRGSETRPWRDSFRVYVLADLKSFLADQRRAGRARTPFRGKQ